MQKTFLKGISKKHSYFPLSVSSQQEKAFLNAKRLVLCCGGRAKQYADTADYGTTNQSLADFDFYKSLKRYGIKIVQGDSFQFHPLCITFKSSLLGFTVPESLKMLGAELYDKEDKPIQLSGMKRDKLSSLLLDKIKEIRASKTEKCGYESFFLDLSKTLMSNVEMLKTFDFFFNRLLRYGINPDRDKIPVAPMAHYQNGSIKNKPDVRDIR